MSSKWVILRNYASQVQADMDLALLKEAEIPALTRGGEVGIYGPGFSGMTAVGISIVVPEECLEDARDVIGALEE